MRAHIVGPGRSRQLSPLPPIYNVQTQDQSPLPFSFYVHWCLCLCVCLCEGVRFWSHRAAVWVLGFEPGTFERPVRVLNCHLAFSLAFFTTLVPGGSRLGSTSGPTSVHSGDKSPLLTGLWNLHIMELYIECFSVYLSLSLGWRNGFIGPHGSLNLEPALYSHPGWPAWFMELLPALSGRVMGTSPLLESWPCEIWLDWG